MCAPAKRPGSVAGKPYVNQKVVAKGREEVTSHV